MSDIFNNDLKNPVILSHGADLMNGGITFVETDTLSSAHVRWPLDFDLPSTCAKHHELRKNINYGPTPLSFVTT